jgi:tight adherence protein C
MTLLPIAWLALLASAAWSRRPVARRIASPRAARAQPSLREPVAAVLALLLPVALLLATALAMVTALLLRARRERAGRVDAMRRALPEVVDLLHLAIASGLTVPLAVDAVVRRGSGPLVDELAVAVGEVALGRRLGDALDDVPRRAGELVRPLTAALVASDRYGAPLGDALARLGLEVRADRRRRAEEAARKVPVKLLFPLVCCVLPAFGLLTLAPLIAGAVAALRL